MKEKTIGFLAGVLVTCLVLLVFLVMIGLYETGKSRGVTRIVYTTMNLTPNCNTTNTSIINSPNFNVSFDKKGDCVLVSKPNDTKAIMECTLIG